MAHPVHEIGFFLPDPVAGSAWLDPVLAFLESGLGARLRRLDRLEDAPARLVVAGPPIRLPPPPGPRIILYLPPLDTADAPRTDWIEPGPIPVFGDVERFQGAGDLPWHYMGGGVPVSWAGRQGQTLLRAGFDPLGPLARALGRIAERGPGGTAWRQARLDALPPAERHLALTPWVDRLLALLANLLDLWPAGEEGALPRWPGRARWAAALSHDVDMLFKWRLRSVLRLLLESPLHALDGRARPLARRWRELGRRLAGGPDPWFLVDELMDLEERHGLHSTLLFLAEPRDHRTFRYHLARAQVRGLLARARARAFEIGLHGGIRAARDGGLLARQRRRLEEAGGGAAKVARQHWLSLLLDETWPAQAAAGLAVDSSLGFNDRPGFRAGTSLPFRPLDGGGRAHPLWELPLVLMDSQLFDEQGLEPAAAARQALDALEQVRRVHGLLTLNWHPHTLCRADFPGRRHLFERLLERMAAPDCWAAGLGDVAAHWSRRAALLAGPVAGPAVPAPAPREGVPCAS